MKWTLSLFNPSKTLLLSFVILIICFSKQGYGSEVKNLKLIIEVLASVESEEVQLNMLKGILDGLSGVKTVQAPDQWKALHDKLSKSNHPKILSSVMMLNQKFGDVEAIQKAMATLLDENQSIEKRRSVLNSLLIHKSPELLEALKKLLDSPLQSEAIRALGAYDHGSVSKVLMSKYPHVGNDVKRVIIETLSTRRRYANVILTSMQKGIIKNNEIPAYVARNISNMSGIGDRFDSIYGDPKSISGNKAKKISEYKEKINSPAFSKANAKQGRLVFQKVCAVCHKMYGEGGVIGPDLTGSNRADQDYILLNIIDPSFDMPEAYRMVTIQKNDGQILTGNVIEEDQQRIVLNMVGTKLTVLKVDINKREVSPVSMMPEGLLNTLSDKEFMDLIKFLQTDKQVVVK